MTTTEQLTSQPDEGIPRVDPKLIQELFDKDPLSLSRQDLDVIIGEFRAGRMAYLNPPTAEAKTPKGRTAKKSVIDLDELQIDIEDLLPPPGKG